MIHDHFRQQLAQLTTAVTDLRQGTVDVGAVREHLHRLAPALTTQQVSGLCQQVCRFLTMHHTIEDQNLFPAVATLEAYAPVAARLAEEHLDIHAHLERVDELAVAVVPTRRTSTPWSWPSRTCAQTSSRTSPTRRPR